MDAEKKANSLEFPLNLMGSQRLMVMTFLAD
jgi:hypothetical protein